MLVSDVTACIDYEESKMSEYESLISELGHLIP